MVVLAPEATSAASNFFVDLDGAGRLGRRRGVAGVRRRPRRPMSRRACRAPRRRADRRARPAAGRAGRSRPCGRAGPSPIAAPARPPPDVERAGGRAGRGRSGRSSSPAAAPRAAGRAGPSPRWPTGAARCSRCRPRPRACSPANPWYLDVSGGFATPLAAELIAAADLVVGLGQHAEHVDHPARPADRAGRRRGPGRPGSGRRSARNRPVHIGVLRRRRRGRRAPASDRARAVRDVAHAGARPSGSRPSGRWRDVPYVDDGDADHIDPRTLNIALDDLLPARAHGGGRLGQLHGLPVDVPRRTRRGRLLLHPGVPVDRAGPGQRDRRGAGPARPAHRGRAGRRRLPDVGGRADHRGTARAAMVSWCTTTPRTGPRCTTSARTATRWTRSGSPTPTWPRSPAGSAARA